MNRKSHLLINGDNRGKIEPHFHLNMPPRWVLIGALLLALLLAASAIAGYCVIKRFGESRRKITPVEDRIIQTGPRGGKYYINANGNRTYLPRTTPEAENGD